VSLAAGVAGIASLSPVLLLHTARAVRECVAGPVLRQHEYRARRLMSCFCPHHIALQEQQLLARWHKPRAQRSLRNTPRPRHNGGSARPTSIPAQRKTGSYLPRCAPL